MGPIGDTRVSTVEGRQILDRQLDALLAGSPDARSLRIGPLDPTPARLSGMQAVPHGKRSVRP